MALRDKPKNSKKKNTNKKEEEKLEQVQDEFAEDQAEVEEGADELEEELEKDLSNEGPELAEPQVHVSAAGDKDAQEDLEEATGVEVIKPTPVKKDQQNVRVRPKRDFNTYIGNQWYNFKAGKVVTVPANVKDILLKANELSPL